MDEEHHDSLPDEEVVRLGKKDPEAYPLLYIDKFMHIQWGRHDRVVVVIYNYLCCNAISAYHHWCEANLNQGEMYNIMFVSDLWQVGGILRFPPTIKLTATI